MSGSRAWPHPVGATTSQYDRCVYALGQYWWAREHPTYGNCVCATPAVPTPYNRRPPERSILLDSVADTRYFGRPQQPAAPAPALYSAVFLNPTGMGWVKNSTGPVVTMHATYDEMLALTKRLAEKYPDTTYTVVKVCAEVRTPPKPTLEVKEY